MKKIVIGIIVAIVVIAIGVRAYFMRNSNNEENRDETNGENANIELASNTDEVNQDDVNDEVDTAKSGSKTLVVYYSAQSHTKAVSEKMAEKLNADIFEIVPEEIYTEEDLDWTNQNSRVCREHDDESLRDVKLEKETVENWEDYDTILIGYPIWWGIAAWPVDSFVKANDFNGKTVIPFCTSSSSGLGQSTELLEEEANGGNWLEGHRFSSNPSDSDIEKWVDSLK